MPTIPLSACVRGVVGSTIPVWAYFARVSGTIVGITALVEKMPPRAVAVLTVHGQNAGQKWETKIPIGRMGVPTEVQEQVQVAQYDRIEVSLDVRTKDGAMGESVKLWFCAGWRPDAGYHCFEPTAPLSEETIREGVQEFERLEDVANGAGVPAGDPGVVPQRIEERPEAASEQSISDAVPGRETDA